MEQAAQLLRRAKLQLGEIIREENNAAQVGTIDRYLFSLFRPVKYDAHDGLVVQMETNFEETCLLLGQHVNGDVRRFTVKQFHTAVKVVKKQLRKGG